MELETLQKIIAKVLNVDPLEVTLDTTFSEDLGTDSLDLYQILVEIEKNQNIEIPKHSIATLDTVADLLGILKKM